MNLFSGVGTHSFICQKQVVRIILLFLIFLMTPGLIHASGGTKEHPQQTSAISWDMPINEPLSPIVLKESQKAIFQRVIQARLFHSGSWTLSGTSQTPTTVARTLASLQPTFLAGILRLPDHGVLSEAEVEAFNTLRTTVLESSKGCRFDVVINAAEDISGDLFVQKMKDFSVSIHPDSWTFYIPPESKTVSPEIFQQGIAAAHSAGQMVGYDGPLSLIPEGVDFIIVRAWDLRVNKREIDLLRAQQRVPLIVELPTTFGSHASTEVVDYVKEMDTKTRVKLITELAGNQSSWGYRMAYPVFYPLYPALKAFDATKDNILLVSIRALLARFN
jgi:hypothetical protein